MRQHRRLLLASILLLFLPSFAADPAGVPPQAPAAKVLDLQGRAFARGLGASRWRLLRAHAGLQPGDTVRTEPRGAHAVELQLGDARVVLGPGTIVEWQRDGALRVQAGEVEVTPGPGGLRVRGQGQDDVQREIAWLHAGGRDLQKLPAAPRWLVGYRKSTTAEWLGSLLAQVDGRDVPLTIGYHDVRVEIRDQIARTTVEQSFVNHTKQRLEGKFFFPLPADASVSGFGMWIGDELVEGDVVERQKARRIFEQILRERRDPGLLEWAGGNLFQARVFPIEPLAEKRVRLVYTQVLPRDGTKLRYRYALRSELLRQNPLRRLALHVAIGSAAPLRSIRSATHELQITQQPHSATASFEAQDHRPERDFELELELEPAPLQAIAHQRGEDGYFLLRLAPPDPRAQGLTPVATARAPLQLVLLADTSASCDRAARAAQAEFLASLLGQLGETDRFALFAADVQALPLTDGLVAATPDAVERALERLRARRSLGWTALEPIFAAVQPLAGEDVQILYVGDGRATASSFAAIELDARLARLAERGAAVHAIAPGSVVDRPGLDRIATRGGGTARALTADPAGDAERLLGELTSPTARGLELRIDGIRTARVYPAKLPPVAAGQELILLGRYWPGAAAQRGQVTITGRLAGAPVAWRAELELPQAGGGNSFLPRLWAARHIDALLGEGNAPAIVEQVVACSEEYGIATPYTSLLVLETDEDRERFAVERRVRMRDGEVEFTATGDHARLRALQEQMRLARAWRLELRARMLRELATLGEELHGVHYAIGDQRRHLAGLAGAKEGKSRRDWSEVAQRDMPADAIESELEADPTAPLEESLADDFELPVGEPAASAAPERQEAFAREKLMLADRAGYDFRAQNLYAGGRALYPSSAPWFGGRRDLTALLFPGPIPAPRPRAGLPAAWPAEVRALFAALDRRAALRATGIGLRWERDDLHRLRGHPTQQQQAELIPTAEGWQLVARTAMHGEVLQWSTAAERGVLDLATGLGRVRAAAPGDALDFALAAAGYALHESFAGFASLEFVRAERDGDIVAVELQPQQDAQTKFRFVIDARRSLLLRRECWRAGKLTDQLDQLEPFAAGGLWFAGRSEQRDGDGRIYARERLAALPGGAPAPIDAIRAGALLAPAADPELAAAREAAFAGKADAIQQLVLLLHHAEAQRWDEARTAFAAAVAAAGDRRGLRWIGTTLAAWSRDGERLKERLARLAADAGALAPNPAAVLGQRLLAQAGGLHGEERAALLDALLPSVTRDGFGAAERRLHWRRMQADLDHQLGRQAKAIRDLQELRAAHPERFDLLVQLANQLRTLGRYEELRALLLPLQTAADAWDEHERRYGFSEEATLWFQLAKPAALRDAAERWTRALPQDAAAWSAQWTALLFERREDAVRDAITRALATLPPAGDVAANARMQAAISHALGQGWQLSTWYVSPQWFAPLGALALQLVERDGDSATLQRILHQHPFLESSPARAARAAIRARLLATGGIEGMPIERLSGYLHLALHGAEATAAEREDLRRRLHGRWLAEPLERHEGQLFALLQMLLGDDADAVVALLRERHGRSPATARPATAAALLGALLGRPWTAALEAEAFTLLGEALAGVEDPATRRSVAGDQIRTLVAALVSGRERALLGDEALLRELPRDQQKTRRAEARLQAWRELAARLERARDDADDERRRWFELEALCLLARAGSPAGGLWPRALAAHRDWAADPTDPASLLHAERVLRLLGYLCVRRGAEPAHATELLALLRGGQGETIDWRWQLYRLLLALDRAPELERELDAWIQPAKFDSRWQIARGYLRAERGALAPAAEDFAAARAKGALEAPELRRLADWMLALDRLADRDAALRAHFAALPEEALAQMLRRAAQEQQRQGDRIPPPLDSELFLALPELFRRATYPQNHVWALRQLYEATKDARVLACVADGLTGASVQRAYPLLAGTRDLLALVHEEATCDLLREQIEKLLGTASEVDRRTLRLLLVQVALRAGQVQNQPGPHYEVALAAIGGCARGAWLPGERVQMSGYLTSLGALPTAELRAARLRVLRALHDAVAPVAAERITLAQALAQAGWIDGAREAPLDQLLAALEERREHFGLRHELEARAAYECAWTWHLELQRFAAAERFVQRDLDGAAGHLRAWLARLQQETWIHALERDGEVAFGRGAALFAGARAAIEAALDRTDSQELPQVLQRLLRLHRVAQQVKLPQAPAALRDHAFGAFVRHAPRLVHETGPTAELANALAEICGPRVAIEFALDRFDVEPQWLRGAGRGLWSQLQWQLAHWRHQAGALGALEPRLLALVTAELERELRTSRGNWTSFADRDHSYFWAARQDAFLTVARRLAEVAADDGAVLRNVANFLWSGLELPHEAIALGLRAEQAGRYDDDARFELAQWLVQTGRADESLSLYDRLVGAHPDRLDFARGLVLALHGSGRSELARQRFAAIERELRKRDRMQPAWLDQLAHLAGECGFRGDERRLLTELIRATEGRAPDDTLGSYHLRLARACLADRDPAAAIDPASAALVAFRHRRDLREQGQQMLRDVLTALPDLAAFVRDQDARVRDRGTDAPVLRKTLGALLLERREPERAAEQLRLAAELAPADLEVWRLLARAHEARRDRAAQAAALLDAIVEAPLELALYADVASLLDGAERERAVTSGVDVLSEEAAPHQQLAERRTEQRDFAGAVAEWRHVVRLRREEPDGWLGLARAQRAAGDSAGARTTLEQMLAQTWEPRFGDVHGTARRELRRM